MELTFLGYEDDCAVIKLECNDVIETYHFDAKEQLGCDLSEFDGFTLN